MAPASSTTGEAADCELGLALGLHRVNLPAGFTLLLPTLDRAPSSHSGQVTPKSLRRTGSRQ